MDKKESKTKPKIIEMVDMVAGIKKEDSGVRWKNKPSKEGEFKRRINKLFGIHWESDLYRDIMKGVDEARLDLVPGHYCIEWAKKERGEDTLLEKDYKSLILKIVKWFGAGEP